ncbi:PTB domain engulfment adapter [Melia azedarach]|uniref:PTB domain engulfment adapter n=1 Tax=Melia azedarach TaxID=155640 RepID=A0ACC1Z3S6_MELAZ|nr:PTB domain engulfment adapter [Melia azedarach]
MASLFPNSAAVTRGKDEVYVATVPLRATKGPSQLFMSAAYTLNVWDLQHFMVIIKSSSPLPHSQAFVFDFQPRDPENIYTALGVLSGRSVAGAVLVRKLTKLPRNKCWFVGSSELDAVEMAIKFNESWETDLRVGHHDCRDYTNGLVEHLTGKKQVLEHLRSIAGQS